MSATHRYLLNVLNRERDPWPDDGHRPDWDDRPRSHKFYPGAPIHEVDTLRAGTAQQQPRTARVVAALGAVHTAYGYLNRRLEVSPNDQEERFASWHTPTYGRGAVSGGGLYPVELYLVTAGTEQLLPGVYYYDAALHALVQISASPPAATGTTASDRIVATVRFWENSFKYGEFSYHVVSTDVGCFLAAAAYAGLFGELGARLELLADSRTLNAVLGVDGVDEDAYATIWLEDVPAADDGATVIGAPGPRVAAQERSRVVRSFPEATGVLHEKLARQSGASPRRHAVAVPFPEPAGRNLLAERRSSFGRFSLARATSRSETEAAMREVSDVTERFAAAMTPDRDLARALTPQIYAVVLNVSGMEPGIHRFDAEAGRWLPQGPGPSAMEVQETYFLQNYDFAQAALAVAPIVSPHAGLDSAGPLGYRMLNATVGAFTQAVYVAATRLQLTCGAVLGIDNARLARDILGTDPTALTDRWPYLLIPMGKDRAVRARFHAPLVTGSRS